MNANKETTMTRFDAKLAMRYEIMIRSEKVACARKPAGKPVAPVFPWLYEATREIVAIDGRCFPVGTQYRPIAGGIDGRPPEIR